MLRLHFLQQWFKLSDLGMEEALFDTPLYRDFAQLDAHGRLPDESTILRFRHRLERHKLAEQMLATVNDLLCAKRPAAQGRHHRGCHLDCRAELNQEQKTTRETPRCIRARRATSGTSA